MPVKDTNGLGVPFDVLHSHEEEHVLVKGQESTCHQGKIFKKFLRVMTVCQKLGVILESKVVQKLSLEKKVFNK